MPNFNVFKETALPGTLLPHSIYFVAPAARPDFVEIYVTGALASTVKRVIDQAQVQSLIDASISGVSGLSVVDNIAARNALAPTQNIMVLVLDATADGTVAAGAATYVWRNSTTTWIKISESESMDVTLSWANITGRPSSSAAAIDSSVTNSHTHSNITQLNQISEDGEQNFLYRGSQPFSAWASTGW